MADENDPHSSLPPSTPPLPPGLPPRPPLGGPPLPPAPPGAARPPLPMPGKPPLPPPPSAAGAGAPRLPMPPGAPAPPVPPTPTPPAPPPLAARGPGLPAIAGASPADPAALKEEYERKFEDMKRQLQEERERALRANLKSEQEAGTSARVEIALKELQDKVRRDRREAEQEENRYKLTNQIQDLEARLAQERETWVATLKTQLGKREAQDKEIETQFVRRMQEMERKWLDEKAGWQKTVLAKDEEIRNLRALAEKLRGIEGEWSRVSGEKKVLEVRVAELAAERAQNIAAAQKALETEKEAIQLKAELTISRREVAAAQERVERELGAMRTAAREREERLSYELERTQRELAGLTQRLRAESDSEIRRLKGEAEAEVTRHREAASKAAAEVARLRAVSGALERQAAAARAQIGQLRQSSSEWTRLEERYKAEFVVLQRRWAEREKEVRAEVEGAARHAAAVELTQARIDFETRLKSEVQRLEGSLHQKLAESELEKERALVELRKQVEDLSPYQGRAEEQRKAAIAAIEELGALKASWAQAKDEADRAQKSRKEVEAEKSDLERLCMAQAAEIKNLQDAFFALRSQLSKDAHMAIAYLEEKRELEKRITDLGGERPSPPPEGPPAGGPIVVGGQK